ncbi:MAG: hypothetical protein K6E53_06320 [Lachnospiraceae bacterium]|nr:hypothetical protein [Lachnospiraceae bacterium]
MPPIILLILKIIGITLLAVLGLVVLVVVLILFVPIRYKVSADKGNGEKDPIGATASVSWLLHIVSAVYEYNRTNKGIVIRIFGIKLKSAQEKELARKAGREKHLFKNNDTEGKKIKQGKDRGKSGPSVPDDEEYTIYEYDPKTDELKETGLHEDTDKDKGIREENASITDKDKGIRGEDVRGRREKPAFTDRITDLINRIKSKIHSLFYKIKNILSNIKEKADDAGYYYNALTNDSRNREVMALLYRKLIRLLKAIRPRKVRGNIDYGSDDPSKTGEFLMRAGILYPLYGRSITINPDFENKLLAFDVMLKGRIYLCVVVKILAQLYFNKKVKRFIHILKKENA